MAVYDFPTELSEGGAGKFGKGGLAQEVGTVSLVIKGFKGFGKTGCQGFPDVGKADFRKWFRQKAMTAAQPVKHDEFPD